MAGFHGNALERWARMFLHTHLNPPAANPTGFDSLYCRTDVFRYAF